jgi:hypothetical protein
MGELFEKYGDMADMAVLGGDHRVLFGSTAISAVYLRRPAKMFPMHGSTEG